ncbi:MAG: D-alanyl transfer protein [Flavobacteriales bacterium]|nr:D-alanyl transfer protein [Flavobacteriales bacterium]
MLPFADIDFYLLFLLLVPLLYVAKLVLRGSVAFGSAITFISLFYVVVYYPKPVQLLTFTAYQCLFTWLLLFKWRKLHGLLGSLLLALPMVLVKLKWEVDVIGFAGISYITFRCIQVYLDREQLRDRFRFSEFISFLLFTPSLLAGPIDRYERFKSDLDQGWSRLNGAALLAGWEFFILGLLHKFVGAEIVDRYWLARFPQESTALADMSATMYDYSVYLYLDFAGYSLLAIGLGRMLGIELPKNFDRPWLTDTAPDFWKRWHISLGDWLRDYFFRPIYKSLSGVQRLRTWPLLKQNIALFSTFLLMGLWNGLEAHYIISGSLFGVYSVVYNSHQHRIRKHKRDLWGSTPAWAVKEISIFIMFNLACFALYIFSGRFPFLH